MINPLILWAFICPTTSSAYALEPLTPEPIDSVTTEYSISPQSLDEIVVTVSPVVNKADRKIIRPNKETLNSASDGIDILRKLQLSGITINPMTNEISVTGGGSVLLCINGVQSTAAQISALRPDDIRRIEYHDKPGIRFDGAAAVIDYITSRHDSGGNLMLDAFGAFAAGRYASINHFAGQYNRSQSVWNINVGFMGQQKDKWLRDYEETWHYPDATVNRLETGLPVTVGGKGLESSINYNYRHHNGNMFNMRLGFDLNDVPNKEEGDRRARLETSVTNTPIMIVEHTEEHSVLPNLAIYYRLQLNENQNLTFDMQGSYMRSRVLHEYSENGIGDVSRVNGNKYSTKFLAMYEKRTGSRVWNIGVSNNSSFIHNTYHQLDVMDVNINQSQTVLTGEYSDRFGNWSAVFNLRAGYNHLKQEKRVSNKLFLLPGINISFRPANRYFLRYTASLDYTMPGASEISAVSQSVQNGLIRRGNPDLKSFRSIKQTLTASFESQYISVETGLEYRNEHNPIMEAVLLENGTFVRTYFNQRSFQQLRIGATLSVRPWKKHLSITAEPVMSRYFSHGIDYFHCQNIFRIGWSVDFSYGNWLAYGNIMSGPANRMYGEEIIEEKDMNQIMIGYKRPVWTLHLGVFNAFMRNYWMETRNLSALTPYRSKAHSGRSSSYVAVKFNLSLDFGRKIRSANIPDIDNNNDSGILTGTK